MTSLTVSSTKCHRNTRCLQHFGSDLEWTSSTRISPRARRRFKNEDKLEEDTIAFCLSGDYELGTAKREIVNSIVTILSEVFFIFVKVRKSEIEIASNAITFWPSILIGIKKDPNLTTDQRK